MSTRLLSPCNALSGEGNPSWAGCERDSEWDSGPAAQAWPSHRGVTFWHGTTLGWVFFHPAAHCRVLWSSLHPTPPLPWWFQNLPVHPALGSLCRITEPAQVGTQVTRSRAENERRQQEPWRVMKKGSARGRLIRLQVMRDDTPWGLLKHSHGPRQGMSSTWVLPTAQGAQKHLTLSCRCHQPDTQALLLCRQWTQKIRRFLHNSYTAEGISSGHLKPSHFF